MSIGPAAPSVDPARTIPPVAEVATGSLGLIVIGGVDMAASFPGRPLLLVPVLLLVASSALLGAALLMLARARAFAWDSFITVGRWALVAYLLSAGMIAYAFVRNGTSGGPLLIVLLMLVVFAADVPLIIAYTVARYEDPSARPDQAR